jgi:glycosyltransferase involved in cell wall biosynthesis
MGIFRKFNSKYLNPYILILSKDALSMEFSQEMKDADLSNFGLYNIPFNEVSDYLHVADVGLIFYKPAYSNIGRNPTKLGEYWASGIPVLATQGIGDLEMLQEKYPAGLVLINNSLQDIDQKLEQLKFNNQAVLRTYAVDYCSLEKGVSFYKEVYSKLVN